MRAWISFHECPTMKRAHVGAQLDLPATRGQDDGFDVLPLGVDQGSIEVEEHGAFCVAWVADYRGQRRARRTNGIASIFLCVAENIWLGDRFFARRA